MYHLALINTQLTWCWSTLMKEARYFSLWRVKERKSLSSASQLSWAFNFWSGAAFMNQVLLLFGKKKIHKSIVFYAVHTHTLRRAICKLHLIWYSHVLTFLKGSDHKWSCGFLKGVCSAHLLARSQSISVGSFRRDPYYTVKIANYNNLSITSVASTASFSGVQVWGNRLIKTMKRF